MMDWNGGDWSGWTWFAMTMCMVVFVGLSAWIVWLVARRPNDGASTTPSGATPEEVLRQRFAAGEIDATELEQRATVLRTHGKATAGSGHQ
jgi:putative membrane protein